MDVGSATSQSIYGYQAALSATVAPPLAQVASTVADPNAAAAVQPAATGGLDSNSATALLASLGVGGQQVNAGGSASVAIAAYQAQQGYPVSAPAAQGNPSATPTTTVAAADDTGNGQVPAVAPALTTDAASQDPSTNPALQQALQASLNPANVSLLA